MILTNTAHNDSRQSGSLWLLAVTIIVGHTYAMVPTATAGEHDVKRATVRLLSERENIGHAVIDDERGFVYFELVQAMSGSSVRLPYASSFDIANALKKVYAASLSGESEAEPLFDQDDDSGYFFAGDDPFSPDKRYMALYKMKAGRVQPGVFDFQENSFKHFDVDASYSSVLSSLFWTSDSEFVLVADNGEVEASDWVNGSRAAAAWREMGWAHGRLTADVVGTGRYATQSFSKESDFVIVNVQTGSVRFEDGGNILAVYASRVPSETAAVYLGPQGADSETDELLLSIVEFSKDGAGLGESVLLGPVRLIAWSHTARYLLIERSDVSSRKEKFGRVYSIVDAKTTSIVQNLPEEAASPVWVGDTLVYAKGETGVNVEGRSSGLDHHFARDLLIGLQIPPPVAVSHDSVFYIEHGELWKKSLTGDFEKLTEELPFDILIRDENFRHNLPAMKSSAHMRSRELHEVIFNSVVDEHLHVIKFCSNGRSYSAVAYPSEEAHLLAASFHGSVFLRNEYDRGSSLLYVDREGTKKTLYQFNEMLSGVSPAVGPIRLSHKDYNGSSATSWLYLPAGAAIGSAKKYPLVVIPYAGLAYGNQPPSGVGYAENIWDVDLAANTAVEVFAAEGYAVLLPSIPLGDFGLPGEPMTRMMPAILSSVEAAVSTGYVDADRLALSGQSYGGYTALSVATQTDRFKAIIAMASISNLTSKYGQFLRHLSLGANRVTPPGLPDIDFLEEGHGRMGGAPWDDIDRYVRNSPLFYVAAVETPILLIHGDLDSAVPVTQTEEFFSALSRSGKDAIFVRYGDEGHTIKRHQNQYHMWHQVFEFLEENGVSPDSKTNMRVH